MLVAPAQNSVPLLIMVQEVGEVAVAVRQALVLAEHMVQEAAAVLLVAAVRLLQVLGGSSTSSIDALTVTNTGHAPLFVTSVSSNDPGEFAPGTSTCPATGLNCPLGQTGAGGDESSVYSNTR